MPGQARGPPREYRPGLLTIVDKVFRHRMNGARLEASLRLRGT